MMFDKETFKVALKNTVPVMAGYVVMGIAFGLLLSSIGFNPLWALIMGVIIYGGTMQFIAVDLLATQAPFISVALMTFLIHSRHIFYSISMIEKFKNQGKERDYLFYALTDETYALLNLPVTEDIDIKKYNFYVSILDQSYWIVGGVLGSLLGSLSVLNTTGVDFSMTALFIIILIEQISTSTIYFPVLVGMGSGVLCLLIFGPDNFLLPAMISILVLLLLLKPYYDKKERENTDA